MVYGDCEACANIGSELCQNCEHGAELFDHYVEATPEQIAARQEKELREAENELIKRHISVPLTPEFREAFLKAKRFTGDEPARPAFLAVHAAVDHLIATDSYRIAEIYCAVPEELVGEFIVRLDDTGAHVAGHINWPDMKEFWTAKNWIEDPDVDRLFELTQKYLVFRPTRDRGIYFTPELCQGVTAALWPIKRIGYTGVNNPVIFESNIDRALIMPVKMD